MDVLFAGDVNQPQVELAKGEGMSGRQKVVIIGAGVGGLTAAHELIERDFEVEVFERRYRAEGRRRASESTRPADPCPAPAACCRGSTVFGSFPAGIGIFRTHWGASRATDIENTGATRRCEITS